MSIWFVEDVEDMPDQVRDMCRDKFTEFGFVNCEVTTEAVCAKGENYSSKVLRVIADDGAKKFSIITKSGLTQEYFRIANCVALLFQNELLMYRDLLPKFTDLQHYFGIPVEDSFVHAKCYGSADNPIEVIMLEDLKQLGFRNFDIQRVYYDNDEVLLTLQELARFHALSFVLKEQDRIFYNEITEKLVDIFTIEYNNTALQTYFTVLEQGTSVYFSNESEKRYLKESIKLLDIDKYKSRHDADMASKYSVITHGWLWINKIMFKYKNLKPEAVKLIDYQAATVAKASIDVQLFLFNATAYETRKKQHKHWINHYYECFTEFLNKFNIRSNDAYPKEVFDCDLKRDAQICFGISLLMASFFAREEEVSMKYNKSHVIDGPAQRYREKAETLMKTVRELDYLELS